MIKTLNHVAMVVPDLEVAAQRYAKVMGAQVSAPVDLPEHGVTTVFVTLGNTKLELLHPLGSHSPVAKFLDRNPDGGIHHLCFDVADIEAAKTSLRKDGVRILGDGEPKIGAHGKPVLFLHPKDLFGTLVEIEEGSSE